MLHCGAAVLLNCCLVPLQIGMFLCLVEAVPPSITSHTFFSFNRSMALSRWMLCSSLFRLPSMALPRRCKRHDRHQARLAGRTSGRGVCPVVKSNVPCDSSGMNVSLQTNIPMSFDCTLLWFH